MTISRIKRRGNPPSVGLAAIAGRVLYVAAALTCLDLCWMVATIIPILIWPRLAPGRHTPNELVFGPACGILKRFGMQLI